MSDAISPPMAEPTELTPEQLRYQKVLTAEEIARLRNRPGALAYITRLKERLGERLGGAASGIEGLDITDPSNAAAARGTLGIFRRAREVRAGPEAGAGLRPGKFSKGVDEAIAAAQLKKDTEYWEGTAEPQYGESERRIRDLLEKPTFSAEWLSAARSGIARTIKGSEEDRLRMASAALGLRGLDPSSPAGAALAARAALDADSELADSLRELGVNTRLIEQSSTEREAGLLSDLVTRRLGMRTAFLAKDRDRMFDLSNDIASIMEAVRAQKELEDFQRDMLREEADYARRAAYLGMGTAGIKAAAAIAAG